MKVRVTLCICMGISLVLCISQILHTNAKYTTDTYYICEYGDMLDLTESIGMEIEGVQWFSIKDICDQYHFSDISDNGYYVFVNIRLTNNSNLSQSVDLTQLYIETLGYQNGISLEIFTLIDNNIKTLLPTIEPNESVEITLPFTIYEFQWKKKDWNSVQEREYSIVCYSYPEKRCWKINGR